ncbi:MAG: redoxin domain-containing protein [Acidobacteria bacterium]|nr:redoxin domain-containing protein [Acidobacteriota bacterium]
MRDLMLSSVVLVVLSATAFGQSAPARIDVTKLGPQVGETIANFRLQDQRGAMWTRDGLMGPNGLMLVFSRSADWCPYCKTQLVELQSRLPDLRKKGLGLAVVTYDSPAILADFSRRRSITFPLLSDSGSATIKTFGILNTTVDPTSTNYGIPFPGTFIVNRRGVVTARFFEEAYQERNTVSSILLKLGDADRAVDAQQITTDHMAMTTYVSDQVVAPGSLFSIVADITPRPGMHVYAPGNHDYKVVAFRLNAQPFLQMRPVRYPASEIYVFKPLNERVEVFQKPFRLTQDVSFDASPDARKALASVENVSITGVLEYQACDDTTCYLSKAVPVAYSVKVRQLDTERATPAGAPR